MTAQGFVDRGPVVVGVLRTLSRSAAQRAQQQGAGALEVRLDLLPEGDRSITKIAEFLASLHLPVIITNRKREEGGAFTGTEEARIALLRSVIESVEVAAVDLELASPEHGKSALVATATSRQVPVIFSVHDFTAMPPRTELERIITRMFEEGASIAKLAVTPKSFGDALGLLELTHQLAREGKRIAILGMGPVGRHLRVVAPLYGSVLTYGHIEGEEPVAPGQFSVRELTSMLAKLSIT
jgi:3-dehydroquinate dehydratase-1